MTKYSTLNVELSNQQINKLKSEIKNDENNFPQKLLLNNTQVSKFHKAIANNS